MFNYWTLIKSDYLQRTRSYGFLIALCAALALGYSFVPPLDAPYSTIKIGDYVGNYNSAWFGYVIAIMSSVFISIFGYFIINTGIKKDAITKVGTVLATTQTSNLSYLFSKMLSNVLVLLSLSIPVVFMGMLLFFLYGDGSAFQLVDFIKPYVLVCLPVFVLTSGLALLLETFFKGKSVLQIISFFVLFFGAILFNWPENASHTLDPIGNKIITEQMVEQVYEITKEKPGLNIGFTISDKNNFKTFKFSGVNFPFGFIVSRFFWTFGGFGLVMLASLSFDRFRKPTLKSVQTPKARALKANAGHFEFDQIAALKPNFSIFPLVKAELILLKRQTNIWSWIVTVTLMAALVLAPISIAHKFVLPVLWFVHVTKWSRLITKVYEHKMSLFGAISFKPVARLFTGQIIAGVVVSITLALPLIIRLLISAHWKGALAVTLGAVFVVVLAALLGLLSRGRKLFEVLFFMLIYTNINAVSQADFFGGMHSELPYLITLTILVVACLTACYSIKQLIKN